MILKAILLGLVAMLGHTNFLFGTNLLDRTINNVYINWAGYGRFKKWNYYWGNDGACIYRSFSVGASLPPDMISGGVLELL